jgi:hypothetical protein
MPGKEYVVPTPVSSVFTLINKLLPKVIVCIVEDELSRMNQETLSVMENMGIYQSDVAKDSVSNKAVVGGKINEYPILFIV